MPSIGSTNPITFVKQVKRVIQEKGPFAAVHAHTDFQSGFIALAARLAERPGADLPFAQYVVAGAGVAACRDAAVCVQTADHGKRHGTVRLRKRGGPFLIRERKRRASFAERH